MTLSKKRGDLLYAFMLTVPALIISTLFILIPIVDSVIKSGMQYSVKNIISGKPGVWNNFENYIRLIKTNVLPQAMINTFVFVISVITFQFIFGMILALVLNSNLKGARFYRSIMMIPWVVPTVISGLIWMWLFQPQYGLFKYLVSLLSGGAVANFAMLNNPDTALMGVSIAALWKQIPLMTLLLLAGLQNVPDDILEAATIDGTGRFQRFFHIVIPYISSVIKVAISMSIIENFKQFPLFWTMTGGGPNGATTNMAILSYREAFVSMNLGSGAAVTTVWMILMIVTVYMYNHLIRVQDMT
nr:sugar ABC transporter permease [uncultured Sphaerochaeta sp.]